MKFKDLFCTSKTAANEKYTEILKLDQMLRDKGIPHELRRLADGWQIVYVIGGVTIADVIQTWTSCGHKDNLLELMGLLSGDERQEDTVLGWLTAEEVFKRINRHYKAIKYKRLHDEEYSRKICYSGRSCNCCDGKLCRLYRS